MVSLIRSKAHYLKGLGADLKKLIAAGSVLLMLACMVTVSASTGSISNPLITKSYLEGTFSGFLRSDAAGLLGSAADKALSKLDDIFDEYIGYSFASGFTQISMAAGETVTLSQGAGFILLSGTAELAVKSGTVIDINTGSEVRSGSSLNQYHRYFCTENTAAVITAGTAVSGQVDGYYITSGSGPVVQQYVFSDVARNAWYFDAIDYVYRNGLFAGTAATVFSPGTPMTRGMFVTVLYRLDGLPAAGQGGAFTDVANALLYYYDAVTWANANGIVTGYTDGTFQPDRAVTREEMAAIMHRYASFKGRNMQAPGDTYDAFPDNNEVSSYAVAAMRWAVSWEIIRGSGGRLLPRNTATRAEVAQIIYNFCENA